MQIYQILTDGLLRQNGTILQGRCGTRGQRSMVAGRKEREREKKRYYATFQCGCIIYFSKINFFLAFENIKKLPLKVALNQPRQRVAKNELLYLKNVGAQIPMFFASNEYSVTMQLKKVKILDFWSFGATSQTAVPIQPIYLKIGQRLVVQNSPPRISIFFNCHCCQIFI